MPRRQQRVDSTLARVPLCAASSPGGGRAGSARSWRLGVWRSPSMARRRRVNARRRRPRRICSRRSAERGWPLNSDELEAVVRPPVGRADERPGDLRPLLEERARDREEHPRAVGGLDVQRPRAPSSSTASKRDRRRAGPRGGAAAAVRDAISSIETVPARMALSTSPTDAASSTPIAAVSEERARRTQRKSTASTSPLAATREKTSAVMHVELVRARAPRRSPRGDRGGLRRRRRARRCRRRGRARPRRRPGACPRRCAMAACLRMARGSKSTP